jgi:hypothetical protein
MKKKKFKVELKTLTEIMLDASCMLTDKEIKKIASDWKKREKKFGNKP